MKAFFKLCLSSSFPFFIFVFSIVYITVLSSFVVAFSILAVLCMVYLIITNFDDSFLLPTFRGKYSTSLTKAPAYMVKSLIFTSIALLHLRASLKRMQSIWGERLLSLHCNNFASITKGMRVSFLSNSVIARGMQEPRDGSPSLSFILPLLSSNREVLVWSFPVLIPTFIGANIRQWIRSLCMNWFDPLFILCGPLSPVIVIGTWWHRVAAIYNGKVQHLTLLIFSRALPSSLW